MKKLLYIGDYSNTGFGSVAKGMLRGLHKTGEYDILQMGINYHDIDEFNEPWKIVPAGAGAIQGNQMVVSDAYGFNRLPHFLKRFDPDMVLLNNDYSVARKYMVGPKGEETDLAKHRSIKVLYAPIDSEPVPPAYIEVAKLFDLNIAYTDWQRQLMAEHDFYFAFMPILYHGVDTSVYYPMDKTEAKRKLVDVFMSKATNTDINRKLFESRIIDRFLVYFVGANQFRKDLPCLFRAFSKLSDDIPEASLIPHTERRPRGYNGWDLDNLAHLTEVPHDSTILMGLANIFSDEEMNIFYNAADVLAYPTRGEGFGLPSFEAMATKTPVVVTNFAASSEIHNRGRGYFIDILDVTPRDIEAASYLVLPDHRSLYKQLKFVHDNPEHVEKTVEAAYEWVKGFTWENQANELHSILQKIPERPDADIIQDEEADQDNLPDPS